MAPGGAFFHAKPCSISQRTVGDREFKRQADAFREWVTTDGSSGYAAAPHRYYLCISWACPWAHRTIIVCKLKKLEGIIGMTVVIRSVANGAGLSVRDQGTPLILSMGFDF